MRQFPEFTNIYIQDTLTSTNIDKNKTSNVSLTVDGYEDQIMQSLRDLRSSWTGWSVMVEVLSRFPKRMIIQPWRQQVYQNSSGAWQQFNATAGAQNYRDATPAGKPFLKCGGPEQSQPIMERPWYFPFITRPQTGTGIGSDTVINFTPSMWTSPQTGAAFGATNSVGPGVLPDEILFHEMVHGMRQMAGTSQCAATPDRPGMDTLEEFMAIVISNVYRSEKNRPGLRADHAGFLPLPPAQATSQGFLDVDKDKPTNNLQRMKQLKTEHPKLVENMKRVGAVFNPFKLI